MVAVPHDVVGGGSATTAFGVCALIALGQSCSAKAVGGAYAPRYYGLKQPSFSRVLAVVVFGALGGEVVHGGSVI